MEICNIYMKIYLEVNLVKVEIWKESVQWYFVKITVSNTLLFQITKNKQIIFTVVFFFLLYLYEKKIIIL